MAGSRGFEKYEGKTGDPKPEGSRAWLVVLNDRCAAIDRAVMVAAAVMRRDCGALRAVRVRDMAMV